MFTVTEEAAVGQFYALTSPPGGSVLRAHFQGWLDGNKKPLQWAGSCVTPDEWFFVTTLYGQETRDQQRRHIRQYFPVFVKLAGRDISNLTQDLVGDWILRDDW